LFLLAASARAAAPPCDALPSPAPAAIYMSGSSALAPIFNVIGPKIAAQSNNAYTIVYANNGSCSGVNNIFTDLKVSGGATVSYYPADFNPAGGAKPPTCTIPAGGITIDLALSDVDATLCPNPSPKPADVADFQGPVNDMVIVVPQTSTQQAISAEMAYLVFGLGANGGVTPWTDPNFYFIRSNTSGTRAMIAANSSLGKNPWLGVAQSGSDGVFNNVVMQANLSTAEKAIGILGEDYYDAGNNRTSIKALAFRAFKQKLAYWPDSSLTARDRKNVRDGHYKIWGYVHMLAKVDSGGMPTDAKAKYFIDLMQGKVAGDGFDTQDAVTDAHLTPICAMHVTHDIEAGDQKPYSPDAPCDCSFEARATGATPMGCTACTGSGQGTCSSGMCRKGFCEPK
jgi:ABC-type phosphate transport system substrate-binding protein